MKKKRASKKRKKEWIYMWYRDRSIMVRDEEYSLVAKPDGTEASFTRYAGPFDGEQLEEGQLSEEEQAILAGFEATRARLAETRLTGVEGEIPKGKRM